jgi:hypothetical protein
MRLLRVYADTSVFGGCFDDEFGEASQAFFRDVAASRFVVVVADVVLRELALAPEQVRGVLRGLPRDAVERIPLSDEIGRLRDAYIREGVLGRASRNDAEHVASASVAVADLLISWTFKHIVHFDKITGFEAVNLLHGYRPIRIYSPLEVVDL